MDGYKFTAIEGVQGDHNYYVISCPLQLIPRLFVFDELTPTSTGFRYKTLSPSHVSKISNYVLSNPTNFILAPIIVVTNSDFSATEIGSGFRGFVTLHLPITAQMRVIEGRTRCAAIQAALSHNPKLADQTLPVVMLTSQELDISTITLGLELEASTSSLSSRVFQNSEEPLSVLVKELAESVPLFNNRIEVNKTTLSNRSTKLFTMSALYQATKALLGTDKSGEVTKTQHHIAHEFWNAITEVVPEWQQLTNGSVTTSHLRENFVHSHTVMLIAIGKLGNQLIDSDPQNWQEKLKVLSQLDWARTNTELWEGRVMVRGRMSKAHRNINLTVIVLKEMMGLELTPKDITLRQESSL